ncbi:RimK family alpha-L-glutamate ligase [Candidatus Bathyarchaeota archaeon]|nr:RimK family alpha-L-glutamate ligase [Candidatus Bathyarchaeota archaeon]
MVEIACFVEAYNFIDSEEAGALEKFQKVAEGLGHSFEFITKRNLQRIPLYDALFIRATTDPSYTAYIASRMAYENGLRVLDDPRSIQICGNKIHMYKLLQKAGVSCIPTQYVTREELDQKTIESIFDGLGRPLVLKAPYTSFSKYVEKTGSEYGFKRICKRFFRRSDVVVVQKFMPTKFDWRVGVLGSEVLYVCKYTIPSGRWKHGTKIRGSSRIVWGSTQTIHRNEAPQKLKECAVSACNAIGDSLFGVDLKEINGDFTVVEVNDNPSIYAGEEDRKDTDIYKKIIDYLAKN